MHRLASYRIHQSLTGKDAVSIEKFWPMWSDKKSSSDKIVVDDEMLQRIIKNHRLTIQA